jgi:predicted N-acetyltransferase YhbS
MAVTPEKQGKGVGTALMEVAEESIMGAGGRLAIIETSSIPSYEKTRRFHSRHGYELVASIPDFYAVGDDKLILQKRLRE